MARVTTVEAAVSARSEIRSFYMHDDTIGNYANASLVAANVGRDTPSVQMPVVALDEWLAQNPLPRVDLIKLLAQGEELNALNGMRGLIDARSQSAARRLFFCNQPIETPRPTSSIG